VVVVESGTEALQILLVDVHPRVADTDRDAGTLACLLQSTVLGVLAVEGSCILEAILTDIKAVHIRTVQTDIDWY